MRNTFSNAEGQPILENLIQVIQDNKQYLSDIDGAIGDGDHGINMNKGFTLCREELAGAPVELSVGLKSLSKILMTKIGGSMGPLYGMLFRSMAKPCEGSEEIDSDLFGQMLISAQAGIQKVSQAQVGDKTLLDTLVPAIQAYTDTSGNGADFSRALESMKQAARTGRDSTKDMIAKVGRSSRLGERSRGVIDAGAASCCLILESMAEAIQELLRQP